MILEQDELRVAVIPALLKLGLADVKAVGNGKQNYVYTHVLHGELSIVKVTDARHRSPQALQTQCEMLQALRVYSSAVCAPISLEGKNTVIELSVAGLPLYAVAYPFARGMDVSIKNSRHVRLMGEALAALHHALRQLEDYPFETVVELGGATNVKTRFAKVEAFLERARHHLATCDKQLLHGDFNAANLKIDGRRVSIFDFDNCVYGSVEYELANSLYMVLFDQMTQGELLIYHTFKEIFLGAYQKTSEREVATEVVHDLISYRVNLLASWLATPDEAPLFIRQASPSWLETLHSFVNAYFVQS